MTIDLMTTGHGLAPRLPMGGERRRLARYHVPLAVLAADSLRAGIRLADADRRQAALGWVLDVSAAGFKVRLPASAPVQLAADVDWEIATPVGRLLGQGAIRRCRREGEDWLVGIEADPLAGLPLAPLVDYLKTACGSGCLRLAAGGRAEIHGPLCFDVARELGHLLPDLRSIALDDCHAIESAGIGVIERAVTHGVSVTGASGNVLGILAQAGVLLAPAMACAPRLGAH